MVKKCAQERGESAVVGLKATERHRLWICARQLLTVTQAFRFNLLFIAMGSRSRVDLWNFIIAKVSFGQEGERERAKVVSESGDALMCS